MNSRASLSLSMILTACCLALPSLHAQQGCQVPAAPAGAGAPNIFTAQQEMDLGDAIAEHLQRAFRVIEDDEVTSYLQRVGERILKHTPPANLRFQFLLFDLPVANAFGLPGGRIYVSRKMAALARKEDELAGVLAHEIGHLVAHQAAIDMTRTMRELLGVTQITDRRDIFEKYNQMVENVARKPKAFQHSEKLSQQEQLIADQIALYAMAGAGYDPQAFAGFWDRFAETRGKTGGWLSDLLGATKPESRRLREILKGLASLPAGCVETRAAVPAEEFQQWQALVLNYSGLGHRESLHGVMAKKVLDPPLRPDVSYLQFSPDGKYVLAQDDSSIYILSRDPFTTLFRIDAPEAHLAQFTPDSQMVVFYDSGLRVEWWIIADEQRNAVHEVVIQKGCLQTLLAPDGKTLACYGREYDLSLFDVASGAPVFQKKSFYEPSFVEAVYLLLMKFLDEGEVPLLQMGYSPDARFFAVAAPNETALAVDLTTRASVSLPGSVKKLLRGGFAFLSSDRLVGVDRGKAENSAVVRFPSGELIERLTLGRQSLAAPGRGDYVLLRPIDKFALGVMDLKTKKIFMANKKSAFDIYDQVFVSERTNGEVALYHVASGTIQAKANLPRGPLGRLRVAALSSDLKYLAISERSRGAVWDLTEGARVFYVRGFRGAYFAEDGALYADFPKYQQTERNIARLHLASREVAEGPKIEESQATQHGAFVVLTKPAKKDGPLYQNVDIEVRDARSYASLWSKNFPKEAPRLWVEPSEGTMVLSWAIYTSAAKTEIQNNPEISRRLAALKPEKDDYFLEVLDARSGKVRGGVLMQTGKGSFHLRDAFTAGDWVVLADSQNRVLVYSLSTGELKGRIFGNNPSASKATGLLTVESERGQLSVYDLASAEKRDRFVFSSPVSLAQFSADGKRLFVLTASQTAYVLDLSAAAQISKTVATDR